MKILIYMIRWDGGVGRVMQNIIPLLEKKGHKVKVISREDDLKCFSTIKAFNKIRKIVKKENFDILYTQDWSCALPFLFFKNHYCFFHGHSRRTEFLFQYFVGKMLGHGLITGDVSNSKIFGCPLVPNGVNVKDFKQLNKKRKYLGWINKKTETITKEQIYNLGKKVKIPALIAEKIPPEKMNDYYNKCKIFISLPPKQAGCQLSYMETMASGIPKIIGNMNGEGFKYPFDKIEHFKNLEEAIKKAKKRNYRKWIVDHNLTWENQVNQFLKIWGKFSPGVKK